MREGLREYVATMSVALEKTPTKIPLALSTLAVSCAPSTNTTRTRDKRSDSRLNHTAAGSNGVLRVAGAEQRGASSRGWRRASERGKQIGLWSAQKHRLASPRTPISIHGSRLVPSDHRVPASASSYASSYAW